MYYCIVRCLSYKSRISRIAKQVRATQVALNEEKDENSVCVTSCAIVSRLLFPSPPSLSFAVCQTAPGHSPSSSVCCIFSLFRGSNRVVDCSAAKGKANEDRNEKGEEGECWCSSPPCREKFPPPEIDPRVPQRRDEETETPRRLSPRSRISPSLLLSSLPSLFATRPSTRSFFEHEEQEEVKSGRRNENGKGTSVNEAE